MKASTFFIVVGALLCIGLLGSLDRLDEERAQLEYCELVLLWEHDKAAGKDEWNRRGHPNYKRMECE